MTPECGDFRDNYVILLGVAQAFRRGQIVESLRCATELHLHLLQSGETWDTRWLRKHLEPLVDSGVQEMCRPCDELADSGV